MSMILLAALFFVLNGCSDSNNNITEQTMPYSAEQLEIYEWNDYEFTENIPEPPEGEISSVSVLHSEEGKKYNIITENISRKESDNYIDKLKSCGFRIVESASNNASTGIIMFDNTVILSISYSDGVLGMLISEETNSTNVLF